MKDRLKQLSDLAYKNHLERNPHSSFGRRQDYDKEFAELIVRECGDWLDSQDESRCPYSLDLLNHFGVE